MKRAILLFSLNIYFVFASSAIYYVAPTGDDDNPGTFSLPWKTWGKAFNATIVKPGDTVYFRGGIYLKDITDGEENWYMPSRSIGGTGYNISRRGTADYFVNYWAYPNDVAIGNFPILDCINNTPLSSLANGYQHYGICSNVSYCYFKGLIIRNVLQTGPKVTDVAGFLLTGTKVIVENCTAYNIGGTGFYISGNDFNITNCDAYNCYDPYGDVQLADPLPGNDGYGFRVVETENLKNKVSFRNCRAWLCGDDGWALYSIGYVEISNCWSFRNGLLQGGGAGLKLGFLPSGDKAALLRKVVNCVVAYNRMGGFTTNDNNKRSISCQLFNNTSYHNGYYSEFETAGTGFHIFNTSESDIDENKRILRNNISFRNAIKEAWVDNDATYTHSNNSWDIPGLKLEASDFISLDSTGITAPRQPDGSLPDNDCYRYFLKLSKNSQAIDKGIDVGLTYNEPYPDLGWSEFDSGYIDTSCPEYFSSSIEDSNPKFLEISFNLNLANIIPAASSFFVTVNSSPTIISGISVSGNKVFLTLEDPVVFDDIVYVAYTKPSVNPIQTLSGSQAASFLAKLVTNNCRLPENQPPVVAIVSPNKSSSFTAPATIILDVNANDPDGTISNVKFFNGTIKIAELTSVPYSYTWKDVPAGTYFITVTATDNLGVNTISDTIILVVNNISTSINQLPVVTINSPENNYCFEVPGTILLSANAIDPDGTINKVEYFIGNKKIGESNNAPYKVQFLISEPGNYEITAIATDNLYGTTFSVPVLIHARLKTGQSDLINLYPNPNNGYFTININTILSGTNSVTITKLTGEIILKEDLTVEQSISMFDLRHLVPGIYILVITGNKIVYTKKFIKI